MKKVPYIKTKKLRKSIKELADMAPTRGMYRIIFRAIDDAMDELVEVREQIPEDEEAVVEMLKAWDNAFAKFGEREAYYYQAFLESEDRSHVDEALFDGKYKSFDFDDVPKYPDIETPFRLANDLSTAAIGAGVDQEELDELGDRFEEVIRTFWDSANRKIIEQKEVYEKMGTGSAEGTPRVYGWWPLVAIGATALVGAFGAAAGYTRSQKEASPEYVAEKPQDQYIATAKKVGVGIAIGVVLAVLLILRVHKRT